MNLEKLDKIYKYYFPDGDGTYEVIETILLDECEIAAAEEGFSEMPESWNDMIYEYIDSVLPLNRGCYE